MNKSLLLSMACVVIAVSGCDHYSTKMTSMPTSTANVAAVSPAAGGEMTFKGYLKNEYYQLASYEENQTKDYRAAKYYMAKVDVLEEGQLVAPANLNDFKVRAEDEYDLRDAREALTFSLQTKRIPENRMTLAKAQTRYDCWVEQSEEKNMGKQRFFKDCRAEFNQAMGSLVTAEYTEEQFYDDLFDLGF